MTLLFALAALVVGAFCSKDSQKHCHNLSCPDYEAFQNSSDLEMRIYPDTLWITTKIDGTRDQDVLVAGSRLDKYCDSHGEAGNSIRQTWPVLINVTANGNYLCWFVPPGTSAQDDPAFSVTVTTQLACTVYVRTFGGIPSLAKGRENVKILRQTLKQPEILGTSIGATYDHFLSFTHHNEIWIKA